PAPASELTIMSTIRITTDCTLPPGRVLYAAYDFGPDRTRVWPAVRAEHLTVHELSETTADATEGTTAGISINWERAPYNRSQPARVTATVTGYNVYAHPGSSWQLTATPSKRGSRVEMVWQRTFRRNPRGLFFGTLFRIAGRPIFGHYARQVIANLEALERSPSPHQLARRPSGTQSWPGPAAGVGMVRGDDRRHARRPRAASMGAAWPRWAGRARRAARACRARRCCWALAIRSAWRPAMSWLIRWGCIGI